ncbi:MAG: SRPBCC family protein [Xanthobacteraceae bacterium]
MAASEPIVKEIFIRATPEEIFPYLTQSEKYILWMGLAAEIDARPGGIFKVDPNTLDVIHGEFLEVSPPKRIVLHREVVWVIFCQFRSMPFVFLLLLRLWACGQRLRCPSEAA